MSKTISLADRAMLVSLNISQWTARKLDRRETAAVNARHGLTVEAARVNKNLLPLATDLDRVHQITRAIRGEFEQITLPWSLQGVNVLSTEGYMDFTAKVRDWQANWEGAVEAFLGNYPTYRDEAKLLLNGMFREEDYPTAADLRRRFTFQIRFFPVPDAKDFRIDIGDAALRRMREELQAEVTKAAAQAMDAAWKRVYDVVSRAAERLSDEDNVFRDSLVDNAVELCRLLPSLNLTGDPELEKARQRIEGSLCRHTPDVLREDVKVRSAVATEMQDIMAKMAGFYQPVAA